MKALTSFAVLVFLFTSLTAQDPQVSAEGSVSGTIRSAGLNEAMKGVEINVIDSDRKYYTAEDGTFSLPFSENGLWISIRYPGFSNQLHLVSTPGIYNYYMSATTEMSVFSPAGSLFGNVRKFKNAAYSGLSKESLQYNLQVSPELALQGKFAGLNVRPVSGMPGEGASVNIRGISSLFANQNPMVLLDGVPVSSTPYENSAVGGAFHNPLTAIDVNDIESVEFYRDAGSLYGIDGKDGLILINTKRPESVSTQVDFSAYTGLSFRPEYLQLMSAAQHKSYLITQMQNSGLSLPEIQQQNPWITGNPAYFYYYNFANNTNWQDEIFQAANVSNYHATLQGGDEIARFYVALGYLDQEGVIRNTNYERYSFRFNSDVRILEKLYMITNVGFSYHTSNLQNARVNTALNPVLASLVKGPMYAPYLRDNEGSQISILGNVDDFGFSNPAAIIKRVESSSFESNLIANARLVYEIRRNMLVSSLLNVSSNNIKESMFVPDYGIKDFSAGEIQNFATEGIYKTDGIFNETKVTFDTRRGLAHFLTTDAGLRIRTDNAKYNTGEVYNTPTDEFKSLSSVTSVENTNVSGDNRILNRSDLFLNSSYRYKDKFLFDLILNLSSSSATGQDVDALKIAGGKWAFFPSVNAGWLLSSERFLKQVSQLDLMKLRLSYSKSGNDFYSAVSRYSYNSRSYGTNAAIVRTYLPNKNLKWEVIDQLNVGLDIAALRERIFVSIDLYNRSTKDLLTYRELPAISGFDYLWENNGSLTARGLDVTLNTKVLNGLVKLNLGGNAGINTTLLDIERDLVLDVPGGQVIAKSGSSVLSFYGYATRGILLTAAEASELNLISPGGIPYQAGDVRFVNQNTDNLIDESDKVSLGNLFPKITGGVNLDLSFRKWSMYVLFDFMSGNKVFNYSRMISESFSGYANQSIAALYAWKGENDVTNVPRIAYGDPSGNSVFSDRWIEDGSFFRLKELSIAYSLPSTSVYKNLTLYLSGQNLLTFSDYLGYYPEFAYSVSPANQGAYYGQMPVTPTLVLGLKVGF
jgi:TonB-linked SusC/RagA family outer membrane protein